jgi:hypothetical protein
MASGRALFEADAHVPKRIQEAIADHLRDPQVQRKVTGTIKRSFFDLSRPAGEYGGIPRGFRATVSVEYTEKSLRARSKPPNS